MNFRDLTDLCFRNLMRRRTRTLLAIIGVVVGTCAIVVMLSIGFGLTKSFEKQMEGYGDLHMIELYSYNGGGYAGEEQQGVLNDTTLESIGEIKGVTAVTPVISQYMQLWAEDDGMTGVEIMGVDPEIFEKFGYEVAEGRMLKKGDKDVLLFGSEIPNWFYDPNGDYMSIDVDVMGTDFILTADWNYGIEDAETSDDDIDYGLYEMQAIGVLEPKNDSPDYRVYMNIDRLSEIQKENLEAEGGRDTSVQNGVKTYNQALVYVDDIENTERISKELKDAGYQSYSPIDWIERMKSTMAMIQGVLGGIGGISLLVAALGITNTMVMSIYERTKEIGVMKVIGANLRDIRRMFLIEAGMIGFLGGFVGVVFSLIISLLMNTVLKDLLGIFLSELGGYGSTVSFIPLWLIFAAIGFATLIGVVAGYSPAKRAMNLSALESLRNE
ncbi:MAG: ABC transporter permease [Clostridiales bacterium]|nr:ABC transporter permease [Clostridiales bacterium]